jgi:hypothetical protein
LTGLEQLIKSTILKLKLKPTLIHNSGAGVHLVWVLSEPFQCYKRYIKFLKEINGNLQKLFEEDSTTLSFKVDKIGIIQPYRLMGSLTKIGEITVGYLSSRKYTIEEIATWVNVKMPSNNERRPSPGGGEKSKRSKPKSEEDNNKPNPAPNARKSLYSYCLRRIHQEVEEGNRWTSLIALATVAWKCHVPKGELERDAWDLFQHFKKKKHKEPLRETEVEFALRNYNPVATITSAKKLEEWLGFKFERNTKRNGRKRSEHLKIINKSKEDKKIEQMDIIRNLLTINRGISKSELARMVKISRPTVIKYIKEMELQLK